jgi:hypothetical protein
MFHRSRTLRLAYLLVTTIGLIVVIWYFLRYVKLMDSLTK